MPLHNDRFGVWVPHGRFTLPPIAQGSLSNARFAVKDVFDIAGHATGAGNPTWLATHAIPTESHPVVDRLRAAGAEVAGKVITDELAYSLNGDNMHYGTPVNPNAPGRVPGGSSSGSVSAVAAGLVDFALGTDTGGSTRVPASYCGVWGLRTTHDLLPRTHMVPLHPSFDTVTWFARDAGMFARVGRTLLGSSGLQIRRVLAPRAVWDLASPDFLPHLEHVAGTLADRANTRLDQVDVLRGAGDSLESWRTAYVAMGAHEAWALHGDWITRHQPTFSPPIAGRWQAAAGVSDAQFSEASAEVARIRAHMRALVGEDAVMILPSAAGIAPLLGASGADIDALRMRTMHITCIAGIAGLCQVSIPFRNSEGVPVGVSIVGPAGSDLDVIEIATQLADATGV